MNETLNSTSSSSSEEPPTGLGATSIAALVIVCGLGVVGAVFLVIAVRRWWRAPYKGRDEPTAIYSVNTDDKESESGGNKDLDDLMNEDDLF